MLMDIPHMATFMVHKQSHSSSKLRLHGHLINTHLKVKHGLVGKATNVRA